MADVVNLRSCYRVATSRNSIEIVTKPINGGYGYRWTGKVRLASLSGAGALAAGLRLRSRAASAHSGKSRSTVGRAIRNIAAVYVIPPAATSGISLTGALHPDRKPRASSTEPAIRSAAQQGLIIRLAISENRMAKLFRMKRMARGPASSFAAHCRRRSRSAPSGWPRPR
jgi:hypothetical protein